MTRRLPNGECKLSNGLALPMVSWQVGRKAMKRLRIAWLLAGLTLAAGAFGQGAKSPTMPSAPQTQPPPPPATLAAMLDREISAVEKLVLDVADARPEDKFNFSPEGLAIPGANYKGVRTFAVQLRHIGASDYFLWSPLTGEKFPDGLKNGNGPENLKTKEQIISFVKESFALGHRAAASLTTENMLEPLGQSKATRLRRATFGVAHAYDH